MQIFFILYSYFYYNVAKENKPLPPGRRTGGFYRIVMQDISWLQRVKFFLFPVFARRFLIHLLKHSRKRLLALISGNKRDFHNRIFEKTRSFAAAIVSKSGFSAK